MPVPLTLPVAYGRRKPPLGVPARMGAPISYGMLGSYDFREGAGGQTFDATPAHAVATIQAGITWASGESGHCLLFDASHVVTVPAAQSYGPATAGSFSIAARAYCTTSGTQGLVEQTGTGNAFDKNWMLFASGTSLDFRIVSGGTDQDVSATIAAGWRHIVGTYEVGANIMTLYVDGVAVGSRSGTVHANGQAGQLWIGSLGVGISGYAWADRVSWVRPWSRALLPDEVRSLYLRPWSMF